MATGVRSANERSLGSTSFADRKSTRLNSSHLGISYAVFCLKKKTIELRPGQRGPVGVGRVGRRQKQVGAVRFGQGAQPLDHAGEGELGAAEALDERTPTGGD